jgi:hypothetical protein
MKDLFIDNNIAKNFANPVDPNYKELIDWLCYFDKNSADNAFLVVSNKILNEYLSSSINCFKQSSIPIIIDKLTREGRLKKFENSAIRDFQNKHFKKIVVSKLLSNKEDHAHLAIVLMSDRKYALTIDNNLYCDLKNFPGFNVTVEKRPENLDYK